MAGDRVRIFKEGDRVILEPMPAKPGRTIEENRAWQAEIQCAIGPDYMPEGRDQPPMQERDWSKFD